MCVVDVLYSSSVLVLLLFDPFQTRNRAGSSYAGSLLLCSNDSSAAGRPRRLSARRTRRRLRPHGAMVSVAVMTGAFQPHTGICLKAEVI